VTLAEESRPGEALLAPVMRSGRRVAPPEPLDRIRSRALAGVGWLPASLSALAGDAAPYPVHISPAVRDLARRCDERH
jgi:nicotinate phosphoribosyltransferase